MVPAALPLLTSGERGDAKRLIESHGLTFDTGVDDLVGIHDEGRLVATAARSGYVLEMFAVDEGFQGGETLGQLTTALVDLGRRAGHDSFFVYTRPQHAASFEACGFRLLVAAGSVTLLEYGGGLEAYLNRAKPPRSPEGAKAGAVVINGNPFTLGHLSLVERAAARADLVYLFVVREDRSVFPFEARYRLAQAATEHLPNVVLLDTGRYAVSAGTFPSYFLRKNDDAARLQMQVDARLFGRHLAPAFGVTSRFVGEEPYCATTATYNEVLAQVLPEYGVRLEVLPRAGDGSGFISATRVRAALAAGDFETIARLVPPMTLAFLRMEGAAIAERLRTM